ncbi:uncharacterized protein C8orf48-like isoform X3 [Phascolarctos cinereus]|uniref:Uncharacterized protein C8orf48-like isoform X1 n=2 Tax=Phascolarctos cinereus TaxID=38626 RepID=A0A6P5JMK6_PHACI|nr:uncharacterized protein C8orf48-like isoform X1 [Phascolarctos cinereus]
MPSLKDEAMPYVVLDGASPKRARDDSHQSVVDHSSVHSSYSSETFESFTEEEEEEEEEKEKCQLTEGKPSGSLVSSEECQAGPSARGNQPMSKKLMPSLKDEDEPLKPLDSAALERKLSQKWIQLLKGKESHIGQPQAGPVSQADVMEASQSEEDALQAFCARRINLLRHQPNPQETNGGSRQRQQQGLDAGKRVTDEVNNCVVPRQLINRVSQQNLRATPSKASAVREHKCSQCPECTKKRGELSQLTFLRQKKTFLESALLKEKMEEHQHTKDYTPIECLKVTHYLDFRQRNKETVADWPAQRQFPDKTHGLLEMYSKRGPRLCLWARRSKYNLPRALYPERLLH